MITRVRVAVPLALGVLACAVPARAQDALGALAGRSVKSVTLRVEGQVETTPAVLQLIAVQAGQPLRLEDVTMTTTRLGTVFEEVRVLVADPAAPEIDLVFDVLPVHSVDRFQFQGDTGLSPGDLEDLMMARFFRLPQGRTPETALRILTEALVEEGYETASATIEVFRRHDPAHRTTYIFSVTAGPRARVVEIVFDNRSELSNGRLLDLLDVERDGPYRPRFIQAGEAAIRDELRERRFYAPDVAAPATPIGPQAYRLSVRVDPGPQVDLRWDEAGDPPPDGDIDDHVPIAFIGSVDDDVLNMARRNIEATLRNDGYTNAQVSYTRETPASGRLTITFRVTRGPRFLIRQIVVPDGLFLGRERILLLLDLQPGAVRRDAALNAARERLLVEYVALGFYAVNVGFAFSGPSTLPTGDVAIDAVLQVNEGPRGVVRAIRFEGARAIPEPTLRAAMASAEGAPYLQAAATADQYALETLYHDRGYLSAAVRVTPVFDTAGTSVELAYRITEGVQAIVTDIQVIGNEQVSNRAIFEEITLRVGEPYGAAARFESTRRLQQLGVFRQAFIDELQRPPGDSRSHVVINVIESPANAYGVGGGFEVDERPRTVAGGEVEDTLSIAPRGFFEISRRNLGGRNRTLSFFSRLALKPAQVSDEGETGSRFGFPEFRLGGTYSERRAFRTDTDVLFGVTLEQAVRTGFNFSRKTLNAEAQRFLQRGVTVTGRYVLNFTELFDEVFSEEDARLIDRLFPQVRLSIVSAGALWDRRDNALAPTRGTISTADVEFAATGLGSQVGYLKTYVQTSAFRTLDRARRHVLAVRAQFGAARGFERTVVDDDGVPQTVTDLPASQRFFAGGTTSVRGFQIDRLGTPEVFTASGIPLGGNAVLVMNVELRTALGRLFGRDLALATFVDGGNVFRRVGDFDLGRLRGAAGFGVQYNSPLGPLRLDIGFKFDRRLLGERLERRWEYHLNLGQVF
jgi:outer membrane protein insertion porin family